MTAKQTVEKEVMSFVVGRVPITKNKTIIRRRDGQLDARIWFNKEKGLWLQELNLIKAQLIWQKDITRKRRVELTVYWPQGKSGRTRLPDEKNIEYGCAPLWDAMQRLGFIRNDNPTWFEGILKVKKLDEFEEDCEAVSPGLYKKWSHLARPLYGISWFRIAELNS